MKLNKKLIKIVATLMVIIVSIYESFYVIGYCVDSNSVTYLKDVQVFSGSLQDATKKAKEAGYTLYTENLSSGSTSKYIGYTTTKNREEAITDMNVVRMDIGYTEYDFSTVMQWQMDGIGENAQNIVDVAAALTTKYKNKDDYLAKFAIDVLNCYTLPAYYNPDAEEDVLFGNFLLSNSFNDQFLKNFLIRASKSELSTLCTQLATGVADSDPNNTWAKRVKSAKSMKSQKTSEYSSDSYDSRYSGYARFIAPQIIDFCTMYRKAKDYYDKNGNFNNTEVIKESQKGEQAAKEYQEKCLKEGGNEEDTYVYYLAAYETLAKYPVETKTNKYKETVVTKNLADYIIGLENYDFSTKKQLRCLYPIVEAMTEAQCIITHYVGLIQMISLLDLDGSEECIKKLNNEKDEATKEYKKNTGEDTISLFNGINEEIYTKKVVVTEEAVRINTASKDYTSFMGKDYTYYDKLEQYSAKLNIVSLVIGLADTIGSFVIGLALGSQYVGFSAAVSVWAIQGASMCAKIIGCCSSVLGWIGIAITIASLIYEFIIAVKKDDKWREVEEEEANIPYVAPPEKIYSREKADNSDKYYVSEYFGVTEYGSSKISDLNNGQGKRWNSLYISHGENAGSPICADEIGNVFTLRKGTAVSVNGYTGVSTMGTSEPANINAFNYSGTSNSNTVNDSSSRFLYYRTEASIEQEKNGGSTNTGTKVNASTYLYDINVAYSNNESSARRQLESEGFTVVENNLTQGQYLYYNVNLTKVYTFVGYKTTTDKNDAITDIRVVNSYQDQKISYGSSDYALAGKLHSGDGLYYTKSKAAGTPITGNLYVYSSIKDAPAGYEPVILLSGGPSYNFAKTNTTEESEGGPNYYFSAFSAAKDFKNMTYRYIYFEPSVKFTSGEEYVSGLFSVRSSSPGDDMNGLFGSDSDWEDLSHHENDTLSYNDFKTYAERCFEGDIKILCDDYNATICYDDIETIEENKDERKLYFEGSSGADAFDEYAFLCCSTTHNPYRAIYDIKVYYGDAMINTLFPTVSNTNGAYASCEGYGFGTVSYEASWLSEGIAMWGYDRVAIIPFHSIALTIGTNISQDHEFFNDHKMTSYYVNLANSEEYDQECDYTPNCLRGIYVLGNTLTENVEENANPIKYNQLVVSTNSNYNNNHPECIPVPGFMKPNSGKAVAIDGTIGMGDESSQHYLFVKDDGSGNTDLIKGEEETYISSICVSSFDTTHDSSKYQLTDVTARMGALMGSSDEVLCCNFSACQGHTWYASSSNIKIKRLKPFTFFKLFHEDEVNYTIMTRDKDYCPLATTSAYLGVSRTNSETDAIYDIIAYKPEDGKTFPSKISVEGITYLYSGASVPNYDKGDYAFYYTNNIGAGIGRPITSLEFSYTPLKEGTMGVCCFKTTDKMDKYGNIILAERTTLVTDSELYLNMHYAGEQEGYPDLDYTAFTKLCVGAGDDINNFHSQYSSQISKGGLVSSDNKRTSVASAMAEILSQGCRFCFTVDMNQNTGSCPVYIGYEGTNYYTALEEGEEMITDVLFSFGEEYTAIKKIGGVTYLGCPVSLNAGTSGFRIYMYTTTDKSVGSPIKDIRIYGGAWRPDNSSTNIWGEVLSTYGFSINLNEGVARVERGDSRLHMYVSRQDNSIKRGTRPVGGCFKTTASGYIRYD